MSDGMRPRLRAIGPGAFAAGVCATFATTAAVLIVLLVTRADPPTSVERTLPPFVLAVALLATVVTVAAAWASQLHHHRASIGLSVVAVTSLVPAAASLSALPDAARVGLLAAEALGVAGAAEVGLGWTTRQHRAAQSATVWFLAVTAAIVHLVGYDAFADPSCRWVCVAVDPVASGLLDTREAVAVSSALSVAAALVAVVAIVRSHERVVRSIGVLTLAALVVLGAVRLDRWATWGDPTQSVTAPTLLTSSAMVLLGIPVLVVALRTWRIRRAANELVAALMEPQFTVGGRSDAANGPVHFAVPGDGRWVDAAGREVDVADIEGGRRYCELRDEAGPVVRLPMARGAAGVEVMPEVTPATRLALRNAQLAAVARTRVADVQASRRRIVATSDAERRRIERDLHDGAQQRLVSASFHLGLARNRLAREEPALARAESAVADALANLRAIAHGIFPSVLADHGLAAAIEDLAAAAEVPTKLAITGVGAVPPDVAMAAYATAVAALDSAAEAGALSARVSVKCCNGAVLVQIDSEFAGETAPRPGSVDIADRVGAIGGELRTSTDGCQATVAARIPCGS